MAVEFGAEYESGADVEFGVDVEAGGEALTYASGGDAVDAALGAIRKRSRGYVAAGAKKAAGMFTYFVSMQPTSTAAVVSGVILNYTAFCNTPYQIIDLVCTEPAPGTGTGMINSFFVGDTNMFLGAASIPCALFAPTVQNRFVRFTSVQRGQTVQASFVSTYGTAGGSTVTPPGMLLKVRSYRRS